jgi:DNA-binding GntR family transcriptional regulator
MEIDPSGRTLRGQVLQALRAALALGDPAPGDHVNEQHLATRLAVSRGTLREALRTLEQEGLLVSIPQRGTFVRELSPDEVEDVYETRLALELAAAFRAAKRLNDHSRTQLRHHLADLDAAVKGASLGERVAADLRLHGAICELSGNKILLGQWRTLAGLIAAVMHTAGPDLIASLQSADEHLPLIEALESGDTDRIRDEWQRHFERGAQTVAEAARRRQSLPKETT